MATTVLASIDGLATFLLSYAITLAAVGALTVALTEAWKKLLDSQAKFHRRSVLKWFDNEASKGGHYAAPVPSELPNNGLLQYDKACAYEQLMMLTTGVGRTGLGDAPRYHASKKLDGQGRFDRSIEFALFELEVDGLMAQIQDAADVAINNPEIYPHLFQFMTRSALPDDVAEWVGEVGKLASGQSTEKERKDTADRYTRIRQTVKRHLDSFQIVTALRWREWNQFSAVLVGAALLMLAQLLSLTQATSSTADAASVAQLTVAFQAISSHLTVFVFMKMLFIASFGGMLAPSASDLVTALSKVRRGG